jgi:hypothetical protein
MRGSGETVVAAGQDADAALAQLAQPGDGHVGLLLVADGLGSLPGKPNASMPSTSVRLVRQTTSTPWRTS